MCKFAKATSVYIIIENTRVYSLFFLHIIFYNNNNIDIATVSKYAAL
jgi:hypothetical protein